MRLKGVIFFLCLSLALPLWAETASPTAAAKTRPEQAPSPKPAKANPSARTSKSAKANRGPQTHKKGSQKKDTEETKAESEEEKDAEKKEKDYELFRSGSVSEVMESYPAGEYVSFLELDPLPESVFRWAPDSAKQLYVTGGRPPVVLLTGQVKSGYQLYFNHRLVSEEDGSFAFRYAVPLETANANIAIKDPFGKVSYYRYLSHWIDYPPSLVVTIRDETQIIRKAVGFDGYFRPSAFVQLYANDRPLRQIDLDALKHARLTFRILSSIRDNYDGWLLTIRNSSNKVVGKVGRFGTPPPFVDWREVGQDILYPDVYFYQLNVFFEGRVYEGKLNHFEAVEGSSLTNFRYLQILRIEPEAGFTFYRMTSNTISYGNIAGEGNVILSMWNRIFLRGSTIISLHNENQEHLLTFTRIGVGARFTGHVRHPWLGDPFIVKTDITFARTGFTVSPSSGIKRFSHWAVMVEPHFLFRNRHYLTPWAEFGARSGAGEQQRASFGFKYNFYVRPWSVNVGFGIAMDKLLKFGSAGSADPNRFTIVRPSITLRFFL